MVPRASCKSAVDRDPHLPRPPRRVAPPEARSRRVRAHGVALVAPAAPPPAHVTAHVLLASASRGASTAPGRASSHRRGRPAWEGRAPDVRAAAAARAGSAPRLASRGPASTARSFAAQLLSSPNKSASSTSASSWVLPAATGRGGGFARLAGNGRPPPVRGVLPPLTAGGAMSALRL